MTIAARAAELRAAGADVISLAEGEPDFDTPEHAQAAAMAAIRAGETRYTPVDGTPTLKRAIRDKLARDNGLGYSEGEIIACSGAKHALYNLMAAVLDPGDEVIIPAPFWVSYPDMTRLADGVPEIVDTRPEDGFKITPEQLEDAITDRTRLLVLNSPCNPTGAVYSAHELRALGTVLESHPDIFIASDDIYEGILWAPEPFANIAAVYPALRERTAVINGVSKSYAMTGWRLGYAAGPEPVIAAMRKIQSQSTSNPCSVSQAAATAALAGDQSCVDRMAHAFHERHDYVLERLRAMPGIRCQPGYGAFYCFPDVRGVLSNLRLDSDAALARHLIDRAELALVPGEAFGAPGHIRVAYAASMTTLERAMDRLEAAVSVG
jgi:aspartate aminotransferase